MAAAAQRLADLEAQVGDLAAEVVKLRKQMIFMQVLDETRAAYPDLRSAAPPRPPRHLQVVRSAP